MKKKILLCVSGGIAVYKAVALTSKLIQANYEVKVIMTDSAMQFVTPLSFQALSRNPVYTDTFDEKDPAVIAHIDLADWADLIIVAPATANTIGKLANGFADNMLTTTLLATRAPVWIAPAMNVHMYDHPAVQKNIQTLFDRGVRFIEPSEGFLACGYIGKGRLEEPEKIVQLVDEFFRPKTLALKGKKVLVTAGSTKEIIDPVRYLTNRSTGKMGFAIAEAARDLGAEVFLITGSDLPVPADIQVIRIESAEEMYQATLGHFEQMDVVIKTAAVADYRPKHVFTQKMKKQADDLVIELERTKDILQQLGEQKTHQYLVGFAAETNNIEQYALDKLKRKNADVIVANDVTQAGAGFASDTNQVTMYFSEQDKKALPLLSKYDTAKEILLEISHRLMDGDSE